MDEVKELKLPADQQLEGNVIAQYCIEKFVSMVNEAAQEYSIVGIYQALGYLWGLKDSNTVRSAYAITLNKQICNLYLNDRGWITEAIKRGF